MAVYRDFSVWIVAQTWFYLWIRNFWPFYWGFIITFRQWLLWTQAWIFFAFVTPRTIICKNLKLLYLSMSLYPIILASLALFCNKSAPGQVMSYLLFFQEEGTLTACTVITALTPTGTTTNLFLEKFIWSQQQIHNMMNPPPTAYAIAGVCNISCCVPTKP